MEVYIWLKFTASLVLEFMSNQGWVTPLLTPLFFGGTVDWGIKCFFLKDSILLGFRQIFLPLWGPSLLFFLDYMKFLFFSVFLWKKILLPVKYSFPFFFILVEVTNQYFGGQHISYEAHLIGILIGVLFGLFYLIFDPIRWPFIYPIEKEKFDELAGKTHYDEIEEICEDILHFNPMNYKVRFYFITKTLERYNKNSIMDERVDKSLRKHLERYLGKFLKDEKYNLCQKLMTRIPFSIPLEGYLKGLSQKQLIKFGEFLLEKKQLSSSLRIYCLYFHYFPNSKNSKNLLKTCDSILENLTGKENWNNIRVLREMDPRNILVYRINQYFDIKKNGDF